MDYDILIVGAGPAGLTLARALSGKGLRIGMLEQQAWQAIAEPAFDGREIALTQRSAQTLRQLGLWQRIEQIEPTAFSQLRDAKVLNGPNPLGMVIGHELSPRSELGWLVSNHLIRRGAWDCVQDSIATHQDITLLTGQKTGRIWSDEQAAHVALDDGRVLKARLLLAADSRFSTTRRAMGLAADMYDFGRSMLVCCMLHQKPHHHVAWQWFDYGQTLALLPMNDDPATGMHRSSIVLTLPSHAIDPVANMAAPAFNAEIARRFAQRLGSMTLASTRHVYPLVGVYPHSIVSRRFACVGDAAVGMHPITAHGFNFGLLGVDRLSKAILQAHANGQDFASPAVLQRYQRQHQLATRPLYLITKALARLYTTEHPAARLVRDAAVQIGQRITPFKRAIAASLTGMR